MKTIKYRPWNHNERGIELNGKYVGYETKLGSVGLQRCPECSKENWAIAVTSGRCSWCGWDLSLFMENIRKITGEQ